MITLYRKNAVGIGSWSIWSKDDTIHISHTTTLDGSPVHHQETVLRGKAGRSLEEQIQSRINSRVSKQRDKGYVDTIDEAAKGSFNQLGLQSPMLAQPYKGQKIQRACVQPKLNGLRCLITRQDGNIIAYTRRGKELPHIHEILTEIDSVLAEGQTVDGELYKHGASLQSIQSLVKRRQAGTATVEYHIYDLIDDEPFYSRSHTLVSMFNRPMTYIKLVPTHRALNDDHIKDLFMTYVGKGFEGVMVRHSEDSYAVGRRSNALLKYKPVYDTEVTIKDIVLSEKGVPVCIAEWQGNEFKVSPPGSHGERMASYENKHKHIGTRLTIEYRELTDDGKPFHAVGINWRTD